MSRTSAALARTQAVLPAFTVLRSKCIGLLSSQAAVAAVAERLAGADVRSGSWRVRSRHAVLRLCVGLAEPQVQPRSMVGGRDLVASPLRSQPVRQPERVVQQRRGAAVARRADTGRQ